MVALFLHCVILKGYIIQYHVTDVDLCRGKIHLHSLPYRIHLVIVLSHRNGLRMFCIHQAEINTGTFSLQNVFSVPWNRKCGCGVNASLERSKQSRLVSFVSGHAYGWVRARGERALMRLSAARIKTEHSSSGCYVRRLRPPLAVIKISIALCIQSCWINECISM